MDFDQLPKIFSALKVECVETIFVDGVALGLHGLIRAKAIRFAQLTEPTRMLYVNDSIIDELLGAVRPAPA